MTTQSIPNVASGRQLAASHRLLVGLALFTVAAGGTAALAPALAVQAGQGGQPSFLIIAATGVALILLTGPFLT